MSEDQDPTAPEAENEEDPVVAAEAGEQRPRARKIADLDEDEFSQVMESVILKAVTRLDPGLRASHVNSGPPGFANSGGHANFDPKTVFDRGVQIDPGLRGAHVNSGPPGFANSGGHANFDPKTVFQGAEQLTLPDGGVVTLPPGPVDINIRGFHIQR